MATREAELQELIRNPREALDIEVKDWLDLNSNEHRASLAKEVIALANHGGGFIVIGFSEDDAGQFRPNQDRPANLNDWAQDDVQSIISKYLEPAFQCRVVHVEQPEDKLTYPVIIVPGGHRIPVKAKSGSPDGKKLVTHRVYIRRAGPSSEEPQSSTEWDQLLERCIRSRQSELMAGIRDLLAGAIPTVPIADPPKSDLAIFSKASTERWKSLVKSLSVESPVRFPHGSYEVAIQIQGDFDRLSPSALRNLLDVATKSHSGWPPFLIINRPPYEPRLVDGAIETWLGPEPDGRTNNASHSDFWRISPEGLFYTRRGYSEDDGYKGMRPGVAFDITTSIWRIGEAILQVAYVAKALNANAANLIGEFSWTGLSGRELVSMGGSALSTRRVSHQDAVSVRKTMALDAVPDALPEIILGILQPVYELFDFYQLPRRLVEVELKKLTAQTF